jgi:hypothetical protein
MQTEEYVCVQKEEQDRKDRQRAERSEKRRKLREELRQRDDEKARWQAERETAALPEELIAQEKERRQRLRQEKGALHAHTPLLCCPAAEVA